jgi:hypothetical protein
VSGALLSNLSLLFVPAGTGIMVHLSLLAGDGIAVSVALVVSTIATIAVTGLMMQALTAKTPGSDPMQGDLQSELQDVWVYLSASPLLHLTLTLAAYQAGMWIYKRGGMNPLLNPVLFAVVVLVAILLATGTSYDTFFEGAQFVHFLLGPATVSLAVPLYRQFHRVRESALAIAAACSRVRPSRRRARWASPGRSGAGARRSSRSGRNR